jgi:hypothetical protein
MQVFTRITPLKGNTKVLYDGDIVLELPTGRECVEPAILLTSWEKNLSILLGVYSHGFRVASEGKGDVAKVEVEEGRT